MITWKIWLYSHLFWKLKNETIRSPRVGCLELLPFLPIFLLKHKFRVTGWFSGLRLSHKVLWLTYLWLVTYETYLAYTLLYNPSHCDPHFPCLSYYLLVSLSLSFASSLSRPSLPRGFCLFRQGRDGLDWHRLVLGGQRRGWGGSPCDRFIGWGVGVVGALTDEDPDSSASAGLHLSHSNRWAGDSVKDRVCAGVCSCVSHGFPSRKSSH